MKMAKIKTMMVLLFSIGTLFQGCDSDVKCRDDDGNEVDWFILYKFPSAVDNPLSYLYMDESTDGWTISNKAINSESGTLANTLKPLFDFYVKKTEGFGYMLYNDQPPNQNAVSASYGHSKGVVMLDKQTGVWLSHSTPKFPTYRSQDFWPDSGNLNAQTFMCVTYSYEEFKEIGLQLKYIHAYPFDSSMPTTFHNELRCVAQRSCYPKNEPWFRIKMLTSMEGGHFYSYAKYTRFGDDLYSGLIVDDLKQDLYVKSWGKMRETLPSNCSTSIPAHVYNVEEVQLLKGAPFSDTVDHSKWCVTPSGSWSCIADTNRERSQMKRGGGAICTDNPTVAKAFSDIIHSHEPCESTLPPSQLPPPQNHKVLKNNDESVKRAGKRITKRKSCSGRRVTQRSGQPSHAQRLNVLDNLPTNVRTAESPAISRKGMTRRNRKVPKNHHRAVKGAGKSAGRSKPITKKKNRSGRRVAQRSGQPSHAQRLNVLDNLPTNVRTAESPAISRKGMTRRNRKVPKNHHRAVKGAGKSAGRSKPITKKKNRSGRRVMQRSGQPSHAQRLNFLDKLLPKGRTAESPAISRKGMTRRNRKVPKNHHRAVKRAGKSAGRPKRNNKRKG